MEIVPLIVEFFNFLGLTPNQQGMLGFREEARLRHMMHTNMIGDSINILVWNVRGVGNPGFIGRVYTLVGMYKPKVLVILETHTPDNRLENMRVRLGFDNAQTNPPVGIT